MARFLSNASLLAVFADSVSLSITRRGFSSAASQGVVSGVARGGIRRIKGEEKSMMKEGSEASWVPDPETGFYRPGNLTTEVDVADLRQDLLNQKSRHH